MTVMIPVDPGSGSFEDEITGIVDDIGIVAEAAAHVIGAGAAIQPIIADSSGERGRLPAAPFKVSLPPKPSRKSFTVPARDAVRHVLAEVKGARVSPSRA
jgi:hypothetical protein